MATVAEKLKTLHEIAAAEVSESHENRRAGVPDKRYAEGYDDATRFFAALIENLFPFVKP